MKKTKVMFWIATGLIFLFEGVLPALTSQSDLAREGILHLGYPAYFIIMLTSFKVLGAIALILPMTPARIKEWAYVGFGFDFLCAFISIAVVDGMIGALFVPVLAMAILIVSYVSYHKLN